MQPLGDVQGEATEYIKAHPFRCIQQFSPYMASLSLSSYDSPYEGMSNIELFNQFHDTLLRVATDSHQINAESVTWDQEFCENFRRVLDWIHDRGCIRLDIRDPDCWMIKVIRPKYVPDCDFLSVVLMKPPKFSRMSLLHDLDTDCIIAILEIPGVRQADITFRVKGSILLILGLRKPPNGLFKTQESQYGILYRHVYVPPGLKVGLSHPSN